MKVYSKIFALLGKKKSRDLSVSRPRLTWPTEENTTVEKHARAGLIITISAAKQG